MKYKLFTFLETSCIDTQVFNNRHDAIESTKGNMYHEGLNYQLEDEDGYIETWEEEEPYYEN